MRSRERGAGHRREERLRGEVRPQRSAVSSASSLGLAAEHHCLLLPPALSNHGQDAVSEDEGTNVTSLFPPVFYSCTLVTHSKGIDGGQVARLPTTSPFSHPSLTPAPSPCNPVSFQEANL